MVTGMNALANTYLVAFDSTMSPPKQIFGQFNLLYRLQNFTFL